MDEIDSSYKENEPSQKVIALARSNFLRVKSIRSSNPSEDINRKVSLKRINADKSSEDSGDSEDQDKPLDQPNSGRYLLTIFDMDISHQNTTQ